jgi:hypothetical protein
MDERKGSSGIGRHAVEIHFSMNQIFGVRVCAVIGSGASLSSIRVSDSQQGCVCAHGTPAGTHMQRPSLDDMYECKFYFPLPSRRM